MVCSQTSFMWRKLVPGGRITHQSELPSGKPTFPTFAYETWKTMRNKTKNMRNKKLHGLERGPAKLGFPF